MQFVSRLHSSDDSNAFDLIHLRGAGDERPVSGDKKLFCMKPAFVLFSENTNYDCKEDRRPCATSCCDYKDRNTVMVVITKQFEQFEISDSERSVVITKRAFFLQTRTRDVNTESKGC